VTILCYHGVDPQWRSSLTITPEDFDGHVAWVVRKRRVLALDDAVARLDATGRLPSGLTALTFDDGFASVYTHAFPTLLRHGLPATVFLVAETLTPNGRAVDWVVPTPPYPIATLTLDQVLEMQAAGIQFGSHSYAHRDLDSLTFEECKHDLRASRELLEDLLGRHVRYLAYPRGRHNEQVRRASGLAGYTHAFSLPVSSEAIGPLAIPRVGVYPPNGALTLRIKLSRPYLPLRMSRAFPALQSVVRRASGRSTGRVRPLPQPPIGPSARDDRDTHG
jgi:peptidoglycan/xylan/chitin deacetylase (PgdA/CDA1 family)